jgi:hypothetical protein
VFSSGTIIESKVMTTSLMTLIGSVGVAVLNAVAANSSLLSGLPALAQFIIIAAIPPAVTWLTGYVTPSTARPDLYEYVGPAQPYLPDPNGPATQHQPPYQDEPYGPHDYEQDPAAGFKFNNGPRHRAQ